MLNRPVRRRRRVVLFVILVGLVVVHSESLRIENGQVMTRVIEDNGDGHYSVQCDPGHVLNSNSSRVIADTTTNKSQVWIPVNGYLVSHLPLCPKLCHFQAQLAHGLVQIEDASPEMTKFYNLSTSSTGTKTLSLFEKSRVKYECESGYRLLGVTTVRGRGGDGGAAHQPSTLFVEHQCGDQNNQSLVVVEYECVRMTCRSLAFTAQVKSDRANGFLVPIKSYFEPGQQVVYMCSEGYAAQIPIMVDGTSMNRSNQSSLDEEDLMKRRYYSIRMSNINSFECSLNGSWHLVLAKSSDTITTNQLSLNEITRLPQCVSLRELLRDQQQQSDSMILTPDGMLSEEVVVAAGATMTTNGTNDDQMAYAELNIRSLLLMITVGGALIILLVLSALALKIYHHRREESLLLMGHRGGGGDCLESQNQVSGSMLLYQSYLPQLMDQRGTGSNQQFYRDILAATTNGQQHVSTRSDQVAAASITTPSGLLDDDTTLSTSALIHRTTPLVNRPSFNYSLLVNNGNSLTASLPSYDEAVRQSTAAAALNSTNRVNQHASSIVNNIEPSTTLQSAVTTISPTAITRGGLDLTGFLASTQIIRSNPQSSSLTTTTCPSDGNNTIDNHHQAAAVARPLVKSDTESMTTPTTNMTNQMIINSLNGSIRSNCTVRSSTPSVRTNHSIGTSSSICGNRKSSSSSRHANKTSSNTSHRGLHASRHHHRASNGRSSTASNSQPTQSSSFSFRSNRSDASQLALKGSTTTTTTDDPESISETNNQASDTISNQNSGGGGCASLFYTNDQDTEQLLRPHDDNESQSSSSIDSNVKSM